VEAPAISNDPSCNHRTQKRVVACSVAGNVCTYANGAASRARERNTSPGVATTPRAAAWPVVVYFCRGPQIFPCHDKCAGELAPHRLEQRARGIAHLFLDGGVGIELRFRATLITDVFLDPRLPFIDRPRMSEPTREAAIAAFAKSWRK
jgi:hypothetical protein